MNHRECYPPWHGGCQHGVGDCPANFPEHEHAGDTFDPSHCVWTRADGERCCKPLGFEGLAQRMYDQYSTYVRHNGHQHLVRQLVSDLIEIAVAAEPQIRADERERAGINDAIIRTAADAEAIRAAERAKYRCPMPCCDEDNP